MTVERAALAVVIGRAGSRGLPGKNALPLLGRPMICHTIDAALAADTVGRVVVSTDGDRIAAAAAAMGITVIARPAALAGDHASVGDAVRHAVTTSGGREGIIVILYANVPVRPIDLIDRAVHRLVESGADSVQSYADVGKHHPAWMVELDDDGRVVPLVANTIDRRQDLPRRLLPDGGVIAVTRSSLFTVEPGNPHAFLGRDRRGIESCSGAVIDVDDALDLLVAEAALARRLQEVPG